MICGVLLAGGEGRRYGADKLAVVLPDGRPIAVAAAEALAPAVERRIAVVRPGRDWLVDALADAGWETVVSAASLEGMGASLAAGIAAAADADGWIIALADMPGLRTETARRVAEALRAGAPAVVPVHEGRRGHPVGFSAALGPDLMQLQGDTGARYILAALGDRVETVEVDDAGVLVDVDTTDDLDRL